MGAVIKNIEYVFPNNRVSNEDLSEIFPDYDFSKFEEKIGIAARYWVSKEETAFDLAKRACEKLLKNVSLHSIDFLLYCTQSPDYFLPTTACILQHELGLNKNIGALDFNLGCSGFTYGVSLAKSLINSGQARNVLLVTAETYSKYLHPKDHSNRAIFGDAAAATLISFSEEEHIGNFLFGTDGGGYDKLIIRNGAAKHPYQADAQEKQYGSNNFYTENHLYMDGPEIFKFTSDNIPDFVKKILNVERKEIENVNQFIFHQANAFMLDFMRRKLNINKDNFYINLKEGGNTVSCTIPIALKEYSKQIDEEQTILLVGFGVGLSWSGGLIKLKYTL